MHRCFHIPSSLLHSLFLRDLLQGSFANPLPNLDTDQPRKGALSLAAIMREKAYKSCALECSQQCLVLMAQSLSPETSSKPGASLACTALQTLVILNP